MSEKGKRLEKEQMIDVITRTALGLEAKLLILHDSYNIYHKKYSPEALELYAGFGNYSDAVHRMMESGQLVRLPSEFLKKLLEYSLDVSERLSLGVRMPTNQKKSKGDEIQSDIDGNKNGNLYHYAGNNPIKYSDPNGREDWFGQFLMNWFENNSVPPTQQEIFTASMQHAEQQFNYCMQGIQFKLSSGMEKAMDIAGNAIIAGAEFMSDYGGVIAVACYASGNVGLGLIVDGITIACDISLSTKKLSDGDISKFEFGVEVTKSIAVTAVGSKVGSNFTKAAERVLLDKKTTEMLSGIIADFISQGIVTLDAIQSQ